MSDQKVYLRDANTLNNRGTAYYLTPITRICFERRYTIGHENALGDLANRKCQVHPLSGIHRKRKLSGIGGLKPRHLGVDFVGTDPEI